MMNILLILKEPFLDRIPSLKTLVLHWAESGHNVTLITSKSARFAGLSTTHPRLRVEYIKERTDKVELPTTVKVFSKAFGYRITHKVDLIVGGDAWGNIIVHHLTKMVRTPYVFFALEFPQIPTAEHPVLTRVERMENSALQAADWVITHDKYHRGFILDNFSVPQERILLLPNASFTPEYHGTSDFLRSRMGIAKDHVVVLHSGGFGQWFRCKELAESYGLWSEKVNLVFHIGRKPTEPYFEEVYTSTTLRKADYSLKSLSNEELDEMIASADIGIALYSVEALGYRAELMGLAAGKIGNYLKCGVPVIATRLPSLQYIEEYGCGVLIDSEREIPAAIERIMANRGSYSENAYRCYRELWHPSNYLKAIDESINQTLG